MGSSGRENRKTVKQTQPNYGGGNKGTIEGGEDEFIINVQRTRSTLERGYLELIAKVLTFVPKGGMEWKQWFWIGTFPPYIFLEQNEGEIGMVTDYRTCPEKGFPAVPRAQIEKSVVTETSGKWWFKVILLLLSLSSGYGSYNLPQESICF